MACATRSIRAWAAGPWSEARDSGIRYNAPAPRGDGSHGAPSGDDREGEFLNALHKDFTAPDTNDDGLLTAEEIEICMRRGR